MIMKRKDENYEKISKLFRKNGELKLNNFENYFCMYMATFLSVFKLHFRDYVMLFVV